MRRIWATMLLGCAVAAGLPVRAAEAPQAWVALAPTGGSVVRVVTSAAACPVVTVDGRAHPMAVRAAPGLMPQRANKAEVAGPIAFSSRVCERAVPRNARRASLNGTRLPLPPARVNRIVVIGDTGCRLKAADHAWQACNDPAQWPFARIAARAAALKPDLVLHVGDYLYRENPCPADKPGCAATAWGYGEDGWRADFLTPAAPLLAAAPWVFVRGNHEECARGGQGWWRLLDPHALHEGRDCRDPANDPAGNRTAPYAVALGHGARLVIADLVGFATSNPDAAQFDQDMAHIARLSHGATPGFVAAHFPFNAVRWDGTGTGAITIGSKPVSQLRVPPLPHVAAMLAGHIHEFQFARFTDRPVQIITGFSGTLEDVPPAPANLADAAGKPGAAALKDLTTVLDRYGFGLLERRARGWRLTVYADDGAVLARFSL